jgi:hypothetical protein
MLAPVDMMPFEGCCPAAASANSLGAIPLFSLAVSADKAVVAAHECGWVGLVAFRALSEEIGFTRLHKIAADESESAGACPYALVQHRSEEAASQGDGPDHCHPSRHPDAPLPRRPTELGCAR